MSLLSELQRRNVFKVAIAYLAGSWLLIQIVETLFPLFELPESAVRTVVLVLAVGLIPALIFSWVFEITPEGLRKESEIDRNRSTAHQTGKQLDRVIIVVLVVAVTYFAFDKFILADIRLESARQQGRSEALLESFADRSIAVLPFLDLSETGDQEYLSDGIAEELLNLLARNEELRVISRASAFSFKGKDVDIPTIAEELDVGHILDGSVRKSGNRIRVTAQLIDARSDRQLWSQSYDRELESVFAIQDEIATSVANALQLQLLGDPDEIIETGSDVFSLYLQARHIRNQGTVEGHARAEALLKDALTIDPQYVPAWTELGWVYRRQASLLGVRSSKEGFELARDAVQRALHIDPEYGPAYAVLARIEMLYDWDFESALTHVEKALSLAPGDANSVEMAAGLDSILGRMESAIERYRKVISLDPIGIGAHHSLALTYHRAGMQEEAMRGFRTAMSLNPGRVSAYYSLSIVFLELGDAEKALAAANDETSDPFRFTSQAMAQYALGNAIESERALQNLIDDWADVAGYQIAQVYAYRGDADAAFAWLERAFDNRDSGLPFLMSDPLFAAIRDDTRWLPMIDKIGLPH